MRLLIPAFVLVWAAFGAAQGLGDLPDCAKNCASNALPKNCNLVDIKCICSTSSFITSISCCVANACSSSDQQKTLQIADQLCGAAGVSLPSAAGCSSGGASAASATGSTTGSVASSASGAVTAASSIASSIASSATSAGTATAASTASAAGTSSSGGAIQHMASNIGAVGAAVAAFALL